MPTDTPMPQYQCHKKVWALKILGVTLPTASGGGRLDVEAPYSPIEVDGKYMRKHTPEVGGYFVVYEDGYQSFSPAQAFEAGYTRI